MPETTAAGEKRAAVAAGFTCYIIWGLVPLVFQAIGREGAGAWEMMCHRILWGALAAALFVAAGRQWGQFAGVLKDRRTLALLVLSAALIGINWIVYMWAVTEERILETSLGYYITPLVNMAGGALIFRERMGRIGWTAVGLAAVGVLVQIVALGHLPWIALALAFSFGGYGIVRKRVAVDAQTGLLWECLLLFGPALAYVLWLEHAGEGHFRTGLASTAWLIASGPITAVPLTLFAWAARRMPLSAMGFLQFLAPTISFAIGVFQHEPFTPLHGVSFAFIWLGAATFIWGAVRAARAARAA